MPAKKKPWYGNGNIALIILAAVGAAIATAAEEITKRYLNKSKTQRRKRKQARGGGAKTS